MWFVLAFLALGFLIGQLVGLSATSLANSLLGLLFAFGGGSAVALLKGLDEHDRALASKAIFLLCIACLLGVYSAVVVTERQWLTRDSEVATARLESGDQKYLKTSVSSAVQAVDQAKATKKITATQGSEQLLELMERVVVELKRVRAKQGLSDEEAYAEMLSLLTEY